MQSGRRVSTVICFSTTGFHLQYIKRYAELQQTMWVILSHCFWTAVLTAMNITMFSWDVALYNLVDVYICFGGKKYSDFQDWSLIRKIEELYFSEMLVIIYKTTWGHIPEGHKLKFRYRPRSDIHIGSIFFKLFKSDALFGWKSECTTDGLTGG
jgi:hypothetical protein